MDGLWFRMITLDWYDRPYVEGLWSEYPFFPLFPALGGGLMRLGVGETTALDSHLLDRLAGGAGRCLPTGEAAPARRAASWAPWFIAIAPGALGFVMGYTDSLFLAGAVWALLLAERGHWWWAGLVAVVATSSVERVHGSLVALVVMVIVARAGVRAIVAVAVPSMIFDGRLVRYLWWATGDPLVFWSAKDAWDEITARRIPRRALRFTQSGRPVPPHCDVGAGGAVPDAGPPAADRLGRHFPCSGSCRHFALGIEGVARYAVLAFPLPFAAADVFTSSSRSHAVVYLVASGSALVLLSVLVVRYTWVP